MKDQISEQLRELDYITRNFVIYMYQPVLSGKINLRNCDGLGMEGKKRKSNFVYWKS
jgi:hypothetical protein